MAKKVGRLELLDVLQSGKLVIILPDNSYGINGVDVWVDDDGVYAIGFAKRTAPNRYEELEHSWNDQEKAEILLSLFPESALDQLKMEVPSFGSMSESYLVDLFIQHVRDKSILGVYPNTLKIERLVKELNTLHRKILEHINLIPFNELKESTSLDFTYNLRMYKQTEEQLKNLGYKVSLVATERKK